MSGLVWGKMFVKCYFDLIVGRAVMVPLSRARGMMMKIIAYREAEKREGKRSELQTNMPHKYHEENI